VRRTALWCALAVLLLALAACGATTPQEAADVATHLPATATVALPATAAPTLAPPTVVPTPVEVALEVVGLTQSTALTMSDLQAMAVTEGMAGVKSSTGKITLPSPYKGVSIQDLVALVDGFGPGTGVSLEAKDGYAMTFSYDQIVNGDFIVYDPGTGDELKSFDGTLTAAVVYERDGEPIPGEEEGPLRLAILSPEGNQVTDGHWSVKWVRRIIVKLATADWVLSLEGAISEEMDRATFESGAAPGCHGASWTDEGGQEWVGIPLWRLLGRVDDEVKHEGPAYSDELAKAGYTVDVVATDGYTVTLDNKRADRNDELIVAYMVDGNPLPEKYFPLRLVGGDLQKDEMVGAVAQIVLHLPEAAATQPAQAGAALAVTGMVDTPLSLTMDDIGAMESATITAKHPKKDETAEYTGVRLNAILDAAAPKDGATSLVLTASDGYLTIVDLATVRACADCLVVPAEDGSLSLVMPGMDASAWMKGVVQLQLASGGAAPAVTAAATVAPTVAATQAAVEVTGDFVLTGLVSTSSGFSKAELASLGTTEITAVHPKKGEMQFTGVLLNQLLDQAQPAAEATKLVITAADGYVAEVDLSAVRACPEALLAVGDDGALSTVFPGMESSTWVKDVTRIEVQ
jgi:DMSO/TMAO reductase YedYZ molybdopterin-dependent catalytic subunit